ncbi:MAG: hypothetical protein ABL904_01695 [Hyphomicrobiaceae bacterium]
MTASAFTEGTVAFLDILGFTSLVTSAESDQQQEAALSSLVEMLDEHITLEKGVSHRDVSAKLQPYWIFVSDSLIISSLNDSADDRDLAAVTLKTIQIANRLLAMGYLIRGGISRGPVWRKPNNIFGTAYMQAYAQEQKTEWPRVQLTKAAEQAWRASAGGDFFPITDDLGVPVVDLFHPYHGAIGTYEAYFDGLRANIDSQATSLPEWSSPRLKWEWAKDFVRRTQSRHA